MHASLTLVPTFQEQERLKRSIRPTAKITHKGEIAITEDLSDLTENVSSESQPTVTCLHHYCVNVLHPVQCIYDVLYVFI